jgi:tetratricopeptide (TPR) repeat protein
VLDPLARGSHSLLGRALYVARRYQESVAAFAQAISLAPDFKGNYGERALAYYGLGDLERARLMRDEAGLLGESTVPRRDL